MALNSLIVLAHVPIGRYSLPVPLTAVLLAAVIAVAASFALIYRSPARVRSEPPESGAMVPRWVVALLVGIGFVYLGFVIGVAAFGRQELAALNGAALLFWVWTIPFLPLLHCLVGGVYQVANPFAFIARKLSGGRQLENAEVLLARLGYWPAVAMLFLLFISEAISAIVQTPMVLAMGLILYMSVQVAMGTVFGAGWFRGGDVFDAITALAGTLAPVHLRRDPEGRVRVLRGFDPSRPLQPGRGREALITLWLGGVLADGVRATPIWRAWILPQTQPVFAQMGKFAGIDLGSASQVTLEIVVTWLAFGLFFWIFVVVASFLAGADSGRALDRVRLRRLAATVSPSLIPISLAYLLAHNLTQILVIGPLIISARDAPESALGDLVQKQINQTSPGVVWWTQVTAIVAGHVLAVIMAHARIARALQPAKSRLPASGAIAGSPAGADMGWLSAMLIYTATSLWILAQPITAPG